MNKTIRCSTTAIAKFPLTEEQIYQCLLHCSSNKRVIATDTNRHKSQKHKVELKRQAVDFIDDTV